MAEMGRKGKAFVKLLLLLVSLFIGFIIIRNSKFCRTGTQIHRIDRLLIIIIIQSFIEEEKKNTCTTNNIQQYTNNSRTENNIKK